MADLRTVSNTVKELIEKKKINKAHYTVLETETRELTYEGGDVKLLRTLFDRKVNVKLIQDGKLGSSGINDFNEKAIDKALDEALAAAEAGAPDDAYDIAPSIGEQSFSSGVLEPDMGKLIERTIELAKDIEKQYPKILVMTMIAEYSRVNKIYRNTNGSEAEIKTGNYSVVVEFAGNDGNKTTGISAVSAETLSLDKPFIEIDSFREGLKAGEDSLNETGFEGKFEGKVIFTPDCLGQVLSFCANCFITDDAILDPSSLWNGKIGEKVASDCLTIKLAPSDDRIIGKGFVTADGFREKDISVVENGVLKNYLVSLYTSKKQNVKAAENDGNGWIIEGGDTSFEDMVKGVKRGLIVGSVSAGYPGSNAELSGVAKNAFYIEDGKIKGAVSETMISVNLAEMLKNVAAISKETWKTGESVLPYICFDKIVISGK
ncbi:MAG: TldD/PmbA family protein [Lachnospiraceae bacterium]|nr:TldD/PmbA family protein [Lachnospiraceae bacterium]